MIFLPARALRYPERLACSGKASEAMMTFMNSDLHTPDSNSQPLQELQSFFGEMLELGATKPKESFKPLTDGLGLESPKRSVAPEVAVAVPVKKVEPPKRQTSPQPAPAAPPSYSSVVAPEPSVKRPPAIPVSSPPPLPSVSLIKRVSSVVLDQLFVQTLWAVALVITSNILSGFETGFSAEVFRSFSDPLFFRFAVLEFAALWLGYLAICLGTTNMTFGMWVWGIRISYGSKNDENYGLRKLMRIFWSFVFFAPIFPSILLIFRKNERNILDGLSGSNVYLVQ